MRSDASVAICTMVLSVAAPACGETSKPFTIGATIANGCAVTADVGGTWGAIDLGSVSGLTAQSVSGTLVSSGVSGLEIDCTPGLTVNVTANQGDHAVGGLRHLAHASVAASTTPYLLYADNSATPWTSQAVPVAFAANVQRRSLPIRAVASLTGPTRAGAYSDTFRITLTW